MITIKMGFLLGLNLSPTVSTRELISSKSSDGRASQSLKTRKSSKVSSKTQKSKKEKNIKKSVPNVVEDNPLLPDYAFEVGKPEGYYHIEYKLFPHLDACQIDVLHWKTISKIYFQDSFVIYRNKIKDNIIWIPVMLEHKITQKVTKEALLSLKNMTIEFTISTNTKKMSTNAKTEKNKIFYIKSCDVDNEDYVQAYQYDPNEIELKTESNFSRKSNGVNYKQPVISVIKQFDYSFIHPKFIKILKKLEQGESITIKQYIPSPNENEDKPQPEEDGINPDDDEDNVNNYTWPKSKTGTKEKQENKKNQNVGKSNKKKTQTEKGPSKGKNKPETTKLKTETKIRVSAESYLTDAVNCTCRLNEQIESLADVFVVFSTAGLAQPDELTELNPMIIKLKSIRNLPIQYLLDNNLTAVYLQYNIPNIAHCESQHILLKDQPISEKIKINESRVFFNVPLPEISYLVACDRIFVDLVGVYNEETNLEPSIFGSQKSDYFYVPPKSAKFAYKKPQTVILAVACFDLSLLMHNYNDFVLTESFRHPTNSLSQKNKAQFANSIFLRPLTIEQINLIVPQDHHPSPLVDGVLFEWETALKIQVSVGFKVDHFHVMDDPVSYKRLLLIIYNMEMAGLLSSIILQCNEQFRKNVLMNNYAAYSERVANVSEVDPLGHIVTGFWIDNHTSVILFLEAQRHNFCLEMIFQKIKNENESTCRYYYNSEVCFYKRIYENCVLFGGIYKITLKHKLQDIFKIQWTHLKQCVPMPAFAVIQKLQILLEMQSIRVISQHAIFPTVNELISFDMEFGVPHMIDI